MTNQRVVPAADYDAAIEVGAEEIAESQRLRAALRKLLDALDAQFDGMDRSGELLHEAQQAAERLLSGEPGSAVETCERRYVWQCSNPSCGQIWEADPHGHCPACLQSNGVGWSCICVFPRHLPAQKATAPRVVERPPLQFVCPTCDFAVDACVCGTSAEKARGCPYSQADCESTRGGVCVCAVPGKKASEEYEPPSTQCPTCGLNRGACMC